MSHLKVCVVSLAVLCLLGSLTFHTASQSGTSSNGFEFVGRIMSLPNTSGFVGDWVVGSRTVHVTSATSMDEEDGAVAVGALVEVEGTLRSDGSVDATRIEVEQRAAQCFEFSAIIQALPNTAGFIGDWTVGGRTVHVTSATNINTEDGAVAVGKLVQVDGCARADGSIDASKVEVEENEHLDCIEFDGVIESLPASGLVGDWMVSGRAIHVTADTLVKVDSGAVVVGAFVEIQVCPLSDGSLDAGIIVDEQAQEVPMPFTLAIFYGT